MFSISPIPSSDVDHKFLHSVDSACACSLGDAETMMVLLVGIIGTTIRFRYFVSPSQRGQGAKSLLFAAVLSCFVFCAFAWMGFVHAKRFPGEKGLGGLTGDSACACSLGDADTMMVLLVGIIGTTI